MTRIPQTLTAKYQKTGKACENLNQSHSHRKGLGNHVPGLRCKAYSGTFMKSGNYGGPFGSFFFEKRRRSTTNELS